MWLPLSMQLEVIELSRQNIHRNVEPHSCAMGSYHYQFQIMSPVLNCSRQQWMGRFKDEGSDNKDEHFGNIWHEKTVIFPCVEISQFCHNSNNDIASTIRFLKQSGAKVKVDFTTAVCRHAVWQPVVVLPWQCLLSVSWPNSTRQNQSYTGTRLRRFRNRNLFFTLINDPEGVIPGVIISKPRLLCIVPPTYDGSN